MLVGRLDANYVGNTNCLSACHFHDQIKQDFDASTMGVQLSKASGMPLVDCESCHGPGSLAIKGITPEKVEEDARAGKQTACDFKTLIDIKSLPPQAQSLICLKCHTANATFNLHNWNAGVHSINDVSCSDCHEIHMGPDLVVQGSETDEMCYECHQEVSVQFMLPSHHPVREDRVFCTDCHDPHGTTIENLLKKPTVIETCTQCHAEKGGPFIFEHAENTEDCLTCHTSHGSVNDNLLTIREPFLCLQCHPVHRTSSGAAEESKGAFNTRCTDCHSQIHGTDIPSATGHGTFTH
jgi:DmsE family decaheme c-type cytochrome